MITAENIQKLIDFGGTFVYEVRYIDKLTWKVEIKYRTFNESHAMKVYEETKPHYGDFVDIFKYMVYFDNRVE